MDNGYREMRSIRYERDLNCICKSICHFSIKTSTYNRFIRRSMCSVYYVGEEVNSKEGTSRLFCSNSLALVTTCEEQNVFEVTRTRTGGLFLARSSKQLDEKSRKQEGR